MLRTQLFDTLTLAVLGLATGACAASNPQMSNPTPTSAVVSSTAAPVRYCPWNSPSITASNSPNDCQLVFQVPEKSHDNRVDAWAFVLNHDLTQLVHAEQIFRYRQANIPTWRLNPDPLRDPPPGSLREIQATFVPFAKDSPEEEQKHNDEIA
jgi:hypothetical protein